ncbi:hypothetical protein P3X46_025409 [Hevea brasiliensis]|uniref:Uncharacterized protein n=1 Tax=Hevea brasiliensis TaxID=3981 RepID=A0ABQ9L928_HEVBR|nr:hypothetical protein P3X46_025409 [Hevea brasiliensis]
MVAKDFILGAVSENSPYREDFDDAEETLSLSDLPLNSNSSVDLDDFSKEYQSSTFDHQDFFEFFSEDSSASITYHKDNNIIFCGKLIPPKEPTVAHHERAKNPEIFIPKSKKKGIFPWKSRSFSIPSRTTSSKQIQQEKSYKTCKSLPVHKVSTGKGYEVDKYDFLRKRSKSRWFLFGRFPMEMELRDMKTRQKKRQAEKIIQREDRSEMGNKSGRRKRVKNLWGLLRVLVCESHQANGVVSASFGSPQR